MQQTLINWQVLGITFLLTRATHRAVGRTRPAGQGCDGDPAYSDVCTPHHGLSQSFLSGHESMSFAAAGLVCSHHLSMPMYGWRPADRGICALALLSATTVGILRVVADRHWWSDVVTGAALGTATGFGLPFILHYGVGPDGAMLRVGGQKVTFMPLASPTTAGLTAMVF